MWKSSWPLWKQVLVSQDGSVFKGKNIFVVNASCGINTRIINAREVKIEELEDIYKEERNNKIIEIFNS